MSIAVITDTHAGHQLGLCNPDVMLPDLDSGTEYSPELSYTQKYMWGVHSELVGAASQLDDLTLIILGDVTHGMKHIDQLMSNRLADQFLIAIANLRPWLALPNLRKIRIAAGTASHEFGEASSAIMLKHMIEQARPDIDVTVVFHGLLYDEQAGLVDYSHHGPNQGIRVWTRENVARLSLRSQMLDEVLDGKQVPDLYLRGHIHMPIDIVEKVGPHTSRLAVVPSLCGMSVYARQVGKSPYKLTNGGLVGSDMITHTLDLRTIDDDRPTEPSGQRVGRDTAEGTDRRGWLGRWRNSGRAQASDARRK